MRFAVDPWDPGYGMAYDAEPGEPADDVDPDVEVPAARWRPLPPDPAVTPPPVVRFVDGVRRVDAQAWIDDGIPALCASYAAGVVCCRAGEVARVQAALVRRGLFTTAAGADDVVTRAGTYRAVAARARAGLPPMQALSLELQRDLADVEAEAADAARAGEEPDDLLVVDGPLHRRVQRPRTVGFVKSHRSEYLPPGPAAVVATLAAGQRTPVFSVASSWPRYSWYLRLPCRPGGPWAGIVRVECSGELPPGEAFLLAARTQATLGRYASVEYKDARAPQNLYPVAGLERTLRRRLGEQPLLYRALRAAG